jgi:hypothetical protein
MRAVITDFNETSSCLWCDRTAEGVQIAFEDFCIGEGHLCWKCLQQAVRVYHKQQPATEPPRRSRREETPS